VVVVDMNSYGGDYYLIPCTQTDEGGLVFGLPEALDAYLPKGRAAVRAHEARDVKADGNLKFRMQVAAGLR
jgi:hypothetical protein